jgi:hypothetical protein
MRRILDGPVRGVEVELAVAAGASAAAWRADGPSVGAGVRVGSEGTRVMAADGAIDGVIEVALEVGWTGVLVGVVLQFSRSKLD